MMATTPDKVLLRVLWDYVRANGRSPAIGFSEIAETVLALQHDGVDVYSSDAPEDIVEVMQPDVQMLERMGLLTVSNGAAELTDAGEVIGSSVQLPA